jgi:hypothetical protein
MSENYRRIDACRISGSDNFVTVLDLGEQELTGVFPRTRDEYVESCPVELVWCPDSGLVQLAHSFAPEQMYGDNYGYRSGLNQSMVKHLTDKVLFLQDRAALKSGDVVLDIGANDGTSLKAYSVPGLTRLGIDPTGEKWRQYYPADIALVADFFTADNYRSVESRPAKIVTSIAMFYDLENPIGFARDIEDILAPDGIWHFEQSYLPSMLRANSYDTMCHEHLEYYSLGAVKRILDAAGMKVVDVQMNSINGGSFAVTAAKQASIVPVNSAIIEWMLGEEASMGLDTLEPYRAFAERAFKHRTSLLKLLRALRADGKKVLGYGASTKGNVTLQFCGITTNEIDAIAEVNPDKFGSFTPGTRIPIVSEAAALAMRPDYYLVLPWHFRDGILQREREYISGGGKFIFPFPNIEII